MTEPARWIAEIVYQTDAGPVDVVHYLSELEDLHDLVEQGPHWDTIDQILVRRHDPLQRLTVEEALQL